jgi:GxxExxY protein
VKEAPKKEEVPHKEIVDKIISAAAEVSRILGPCFEKSVYTIALAKEFKLRKMSFLMEKLVKIPYKGIIVGNNKLDFLVEDKIVVMLKVEKEIDSIMRGELGSYLRIIKKPVGMIINFAQPKLDIDIIIGGGAPQQMKQ